MLMLALLAFFQTFVVKHSNLLTKFHRKFQASSFFFQLIYRVFNHNDIIPEDHFTNFFESFVVNHSNLLTKFHRKFHAFSVVFLTTII